MNQLMEVKHNLRVLKSNCKMLFKKELVVLIYSVFGSSVVKCRSSGLAANTVTELPCQPNEEYLKARTETPDS